MWSSNGSIDVKPAVSIVNSKLTDIRHWSLLTNSFFKLFDSFPATADGLWLYRQKLFSYDAENSSDKISEKFTKVIDAFMCLPLNIPGTTYHKCLKVIKIK